MAKVDSELEELIDQDTRRKPPQDKLEFVRDQVKVARDLNRKIQDAEELVSSLKGQKRELEMFLLPDLFQQIGITHIGLTSEGNEPAYEAKLKDYYHASIAADWPDEKRDKAMHWIEKHKMGDLVKTVLTIELGKGMDDMREDVEKALDDLMVPYHKYQTVPWNTLTAAIREMYQSGKPLKNHEVELLGATVGKIVRLTPKKED